MNSVEVENYTISQNMYSSLHFKTAGSEVDPTLKKLL